MTEPNNPNNLTPPPELVRQIRSDAQSKCDGHLDCERRMIYSAFRAGADQELEACVRWLQDEMLAPSEWSTGLRAARRPKQPSLRDQALSKISAILNDPSRAMLEDEHEALELSRRALGQLPEGPDVTHSIDWEYMGGPIHAGTVTTRIVTKAPEPAPASDRPLWEQALAELDAAVLRGDCIATSAATPLLRRALEQLP